jgi:hypothetical protein
MTKYGAIPTTVDNVTFASRAEARRYAELRLLQRSGAIKDLACHPRWPLTVNGLKVATYVADFAYSDAATGRFCVEDVKGVRTPVYKLKRKLMAWT